MSTIKASNFGWLAMLLSLVVMLPAIAATRQGDAPLLDFATTQKFEPADDQERLETDLQQAQGEIERNPPPMEDCAHILGASRFAAMLDDLSAARSALGDYSGAVEALRKALECNPRAAHLHATLAAELMHLGEIDAARDAANRAMAIDPDNFVAQAVLARLAFLEENWADAIPRLRTIVANAQDDVQATYWQCMLWLAQLRAGTRQPRLVARNPAEGWPQPILEALQGKLTERELLEIIESEEDDLRRREMLSEALYYMGQQRLVRGERDEAKRYFAAATDLEVRYFTEHHMARAELVK